MASDDSDRLEQLVEEISSSIADAAEALQPSGALDALRQSIFDLAAFYRRDSNLSDGEAVDRAVEILLINLLLEQRLRAAAQGQSPVTLPPDERRRLVEFAAEYAAATGKPPEIALGVVLTRQTESLSSEARMRLAGYLPDQWEPRLYVGGAPPEFYPRQEGGRWSFREDPEALIYRGPWVIGPEEIKKIALYAIFFSKVLVPSFAVVPTDFDWSDQVLADLSSLCAQDFVEPFHVQYHSYMKAICTFNFGDNQVAIDDLVQAKGRYSLPHRTKIYLGPQDLIQLIPLMATAHDLHDSAYIKLLRDVHQSLSTVRFGPYARFYRRMWPRIVRHFKNSIRYLPKREKEMFEVARKTVPITIVDYAYYVNLSLHWMTVFGASGFACHPAEERIYAYRMARAGTLNEARMPGRLVEAFFSIPLFPGFPRIRADQVYEIRRLKELKEWRSYLRQQMVAIRESRDLDGARSGQQEEFQRMSNDLCTRFLELAVDSVDRDQVLKHASKGAVTTIAGIIWPPLSGLGFVGPASEIYKSFGVDPIVSFTVKSAKVLGS